jgi:hypothetical protein
VGRGHLGIAGRPARPARELAAYLERHQPHLLAVYDVDFLGRLIESSCAAPRAGMGIEAHHSV